MDTVALNRVTRLDGEAAAKAWARERGYAVRWDEEGDLWIRDLLVEEHVHKIRYLSPNTIGLAKARGEAEPYVNVLMGYTVVMDMVECRKAGCEV